MAFGQKIANEDDLLEALQHGVGCPYLSDLHEPQWAGALMKVIKKLPDGRYSADAWRCAAAYVTGRDYGGSTVSKIKKCLCEFLKQAEQAEQAEQPPVLPEG